MRVGVVCEGPTDFFAVKSFFGHALENALAAPVEFIALQPQMDKTNPEAGWGNVLLWLANNPPVSRVQQYFGGGLFAGALGSDPLDALLIQLDSDILGDRLFKDYVFKSYNLTVENPTQQDERAKEISRVLQEAAQFINMTAIDVRRHVIAPAVEATESWCVAAFNAQAMNCEDLSGQRLVDAFMVALEKSEGRIPSLPYANTDKDQRRREIFCNKHASGSARVIEGCPAFERAFLQLRDLA